MTRAAERAGAQIFYASTLYGAMSLCAAIDSGTFGERPGRRLLLVAQTVPVPEVTTPFWETPGFAVLRDRFDDIVSWNDLIAPMHPAQWKPRAAEQPMLTRLLVEHLGLHDGIAELVIESVGAAPGKTVGSLFTGCPVTVYSDGLMSYGPTREELPATIGHRVHRLLYLDLVPEVEPLLLREYQVPAVALPDEAFRSVVARLPRPAASADPATAVAPVILGQYLSQLNIFTAEEETALHDAMLDALVARGERRIVFRPHPAARRVHVAPLHRHAAELGVELVVPDDGLPAEAWFAAANPSLVVSCFSTALFTASRFYGLPVATMGTDAFLKRVVPFQNSNRIPATIADTTLPRLSPNGELVAPPSVDLNALVRAVGFCMQANRLHDLRSAAVDYLHRHGEGRYFKRRRLEALGLRDASLAPTGRQLFARRARRRAGEARTRIRAGHTLLRARTAAYAATTPRRGVRSDTGSDRDDI